MKRITLISITVFFTAGCEKEDIFPPSNYYCDNLNAISTESHPHHDKYQAVLKDITSLGVPGIMMSVWDSKNGRWSGAEGKADIASNIELAACNITRVGSTVKTFTAVTMLLLQEEGKLDLDDRITKYLSTVYLRNLENAEQVTIRQLLQHSSGIYNYIQNLKFQTASLNDLTKTWMPNELLSYARGNPANFAPEEDVLYSNTNYILLGEIITSIEKKPFYKVFEEKIFIPLNLSFTRFAAEDPVPGNIIRGYIDLYSNLNVIDATYYSGWDYYTADGGLISNSYDLNIFFTALFNGKIISSGSLSEMTAWKRPVKQSGDFFDMQYGLGVFHMDTPWGEAYFHSGDAIGYYACMAYFPNKGVTISWAANGNYGKIDQHTSSKAAMEKLFATVLD